MLNLIPKFKHKRAIGNRVEGFAEQYLQKQGLKPVCRNYYCRQGEIDLIMEHGDTLVFIEVRYRRKQNHGEASETITYGKQQKVIKAAQHYLHRFNLTEKTPSRIDVVSVKPNTPSESLDTIRYLQLEFNWIQNAIN